MNTLRLVSLGTAALVAVGCSDRGDVTAPRASSLTAARPAALSGTPARQVQTSGQFDAIVDFSTVTLTPKGRNCLLQVDGRAVFHGTIEGTATGQTSAFEFAPCSDVATNPPGTFPDVFHFDGVFEGTVAGEPARANLQYAGRVQVGGAIDGRFIFSQGVEGRLEVQAVVAVGGEYQGLVVIK